MKRSLTTTLISLAMILMTSMPAIASQATLDRLLDQLSNDNSVTMVYISPSLIRSISQLDPTGYNLNKISQHASSIKVFVCQSVSSQNVADKYVAERLKMTPKPSLLTKVRNGGDRLEIYGVPKGGHSDLYSEVIFLSKKDETSRMMIFEGEFETNDIASLSSQANRNTTNSGVRVISGWSYPASEPVISKIRKSNDHPNDLLVEFSDPSGRLAEDPIVNVRSGGDLHTFSAFSKKIVGGKAVYQFYIPMKYVNSTQNMVVFYLDERKYTRYLERG